MYTTVSIAEAQENRKRNTKLIFIQEVMKMLNQKKKIDIFITLSLQGTIWPCTLQ